MRENTDRPIIFSIKMIFLFVDWEDFSIFQYIWKLSILGGFLTTNKNVRKCKYIFILDFSISAAISLYLLPSLKVKPLLV